MNSQAKSEATVTIRALKKTGFWRCGMFHPSAPVTHPASRFTVHQLGRLKAECNLEVTILAPKPAAALEPVVEVVDLYVPAEVVPVHVEVPVALAPAQTEEIPELAPVQVEEVKAAKVAAPKPKRARKSRKEKK
jgi:hypothetical protein